MQILFDLLRIYEPVFILVLLLTIIFLGFWVFFLHQKLKEIQKRNATFFSGNNIKNVEGVIIEHSKALKNLDKDIQEIYTISNQLNILANKGLHKFGMIRFNPFKDIGGDQSFAIALLNGKNNGLVISSLYTREGTRIYAKAIVDGESEKHTLTEEERQALKIANLSTAKKIIK